MGLSLSLLSKFGLPGVSSLGTDQLYANFFEDKKIRKFDDFHIAFIDLCKFLNDVMPGNHFAGPTKEEIKDFYDNWSETEPQRRDELIAFVNAKVKELKKDDKAVIIIGMVVPAAAVVLKNTAENIQLVKRFKLHLIPNFVFVPTCTFLALYLMALIVNNRRFKSLLRLHDVKSLTTDQICERFFKEIEQFDEFHTAFIYLCKILNDVMPGKRFTAPRKEDIQEFYEDTWSKTLEPKRREKLTLFVTEKLKIVVPAAGGPHCSYNKWHGIITSMVVSAAAVVLKNPAENIQLVKRFKLHLIPNFVFEPICTYLALCLMALIVSNRRFKSLQLHDFLNDVMPGKRGFTAPRKEDIKEFYDNWSGTEPQRRDQLIEFVKDKVKELKKDDKAVIIIGMVVPAAAVVLKNTAENIQLVKRFKLHLIPNFVFVPTCTFLALYLMALIAYNRRLKSLHAYVF